MKKVFSLVVSVCLLLVQYGNAFAQDIPTGKFLGSYYNGQNFDSLVFTREDQLINFNWWQGSPGGGVNNNNFSVRWQGKIEFTAGNWEFGCMPDDGLRIYIDGEKMVDSWKVQHGTYFKFVKNLSAGTHLIVVEYFEDKEWAGITLTWKKVTPATTPSVGGPTTKPGTIAPTTSPLYKGLYVSSCEELAVNPSEGDAPLEVNFSGAGYDPYGAIQTYSFNFGDNSPIIAQEDSYTSHIYQKPGKYNALLTIKDSKGNLRTSDTCKKVITVTGTYEESVGGYAEPTVYPATVSSLPKTGIFDTSLSLILFTIPMAILGLLLNRKFSKF